MAGGRKRFRSQLCYGENGGRLCTAISSYAVAHAFLLQCEKDDDVMEFFTEDRIHDIMQNCSRFFSQTPFAESRLMMSVHDMLHLCPSDGNIQSIEIAGLLLVQEEGCHHPEVENLWVEPLDALLRKISSRGSNKIAAVVTTAEHTVAYLSDGRSRLFLFDPLPAELVPCCPSAPCMTRRRDDEYSGYLFASI